MFAGARPCLADRLSGRSTSLFTTRLSAADSLLETLWNAIEPPADSEEAAWNFEALPAFQKRFNLWHQSNAFSA